MRYATPRDRITKTLGDSAFDAWKWAIVQKDDKAEEQNSISVYLQGPTSHLWALFKPHSPAHIVKSQLRIKIVPHKSYVGSIQNQL